MNNLDKSKQKPSDQPKPSTEEKGRTTPLPTKEVTPTPKKK